MSTEFLPKFAFIGVMNQMMSLSHVTFLTYVIIMLRTQTEDDHDNSTPPIKIMATMSGPISFILFYLLSQDFVPVRLLERLKHSLCCVFTRE